MSASFDLLVLGGGPGGYVAALRGAQLGLKVCLVEKDFLGGVCLNKGCIPSKTLLAATELFSKLERASEWGIELKNTPTWNLKKLFDRKEVVVQRMREGLERLCQKRKILRIEGFGELESKSSVKVGQEIYSAKAIVLATGSVPRRLEIGLKDTSRVLTSEEALSLDHAPASILILGAGPEGCEFALIFKSLGSRVVLVEAKEGVLPGFDRDAGAALRRVLTAKGITVHTGDKLAKATLTHQGVQAELASGQKETVESILVCVGRLPNTDGMGFETSGLQLSEKKAIVTKSALQTSLDSVYAVGDVRGDLMMAHAASYEGYVTASRIAGKTEELDYRAVPSVVYTYPEVAEVGLNEEKASRQNIPFEIGRFSFLALGRSHAKGQTEGFVKLIGHAKTNEVLGGIIVGEGASDLINMVSLGIRKRLKVSDFRNHIAPHPSASEAVVEASHLFFKEGLHYA